MQTANISDYQSHLSNYHQQIMDNHDPLRIADRHGDVIVMAADDYDNLMETLYILKDEITMKSLLETRKSLEQGYFQGIEVEDAFKDILEP